MTYIEKETCESIAKKNSEMTKFIQNPLLLSLKL